ncbi:hypothetical protein V8G54_035851 [Vigna mungo]|uniref:Uncharacterized protein n=1 Tax=Vigna mungo TaxID=3915 RepID=A0AAQ3MFT1_VIGMU
MGQNLPLLATILGFRKAAWVSILFQEFVWKFNLPNAEEVVGICKGKLVSEAENLEIISEKVDSFEYEKVACIVEGSKLRDGVVEDSGMGRRTMRKAWNTDPCRSIECYNSVSECRSCWLKFVVVSGMT